MRDQGEAQSHFKVAGRASRPVHVPEYGTLTRLSDARHLVTAVITNDIREQEIWRRVASALFSAAVSGDVLEVTLALEVAIRRVSVRPVKQ